MPLANGWRVYIIVPAFNEAAMIGVVVRELCTRYSHVVVVDDGSSDDSATVARSAGAVVLHHCINRGQGAALQTGLRYGLECGARCLVTFDGDGQHNLDDIERLIAPIRSGRADIVLGSRFLGSTEGMTSLRWMLLKAVVVFTRLVSRVDVTDAHNGLRAFSRRAAERLSITVDRMGHASEIVDQVGATGLPYVEIPVHIRYTEYSRSKGQYGLAALPIIADYLARRIRR